jgi:hypothetical protein
MSHAIAQTSFPAAGNVIYAGHVPLRDLPERDLPERDLPERDLPERDLAERSEATQSWSEAGSSGIASIWLAFYALAALIVVLAS